MIDLFGADNVARQLVTEFSGLGSTQLIHSPTIWRQEFGCIERRAAVPKDHKCIFSYESRDSEGWMVCVCGNRRRRTERSLDAGVHVGPCGHVHQHWRISKTGQWINVGVDVWDFKPVILDELVALVRSRPSQLLSTGLKEIV